MEGMTPPAAAAHGGHDEYAPHGAFLGHVVPGSMFVIWGSWWIFACMREQILSSPERPYRSKAWFQLPLLPKIPLEPVLKIFGCFIGIVGELWFGQVRFTYMFNSDGTFNHGHINNWQHAAMYFAYMVAGIVDMAGVYTDLPPDSEQAALATAFIVEGLLLGFHLKGSPTEILVHKILVITIAASAIVMLAEIRYKNNVLLTAARAMLVGLQGIWFIQIAYILFRDKPQWDPHGMNGVMMIPTLYCLDIMLLTIGVLAFYLGLRFILRRIHGDTIRHQPLSQRDFDVEDEEISFTTGRVPDTLKLSGNGWSQGSKSVQLSAM
mmetsp:Transcript_10178/g.30607  ORF Transcript_10178/g.30607 Transcript_10178/m.30607 type:complete len:322 (+) Transcript_10178:368-1333(+)